MTALEGSRMLVDMPKQTATVRVDAQIPWRAYRAESGQWVAECDPLGLTALGDSWDNLELMVAEVQNDLFSSAQPSA